MNKIKEKTRILDEPERSLYHAEIILIFAFAVFYIIVYALVCLFPSLESITVCQFKAHTGIPCPSCGGTRAIYYFFTGRFVKSIYYHPAAFYAAVLAAIFFITQTLQIVTKGKIRGIRWHQWYWIVGLTLYIVQYLLKLLIPGYVI